MTTALQELNSFHEFALASLHAKHEYIPLERLLETWRMSREREEVNAAIRQGLAEKKDGKGIPLDAYLEHFDK